MIAIDTNILVYLHRADSPFHQPARKAFDDMLSTGLPWAITWPNLQEFLAIVTHPKIYKPPTPLPVAIDVVESWLEVPTMRLLGETGSHWPVLKKLLTQAQASGPLVHDGRIAALCLEHGVSELWSLDRDFSRFREIRVVNPLMLS